MKIYDRTQYKIGDLRLNENAVPFYETKSKIDMNDLLKIDGHLYSPCIMGKDYCVVKEINVLELNDNPEDMDYTNEIKCPYCESEIESFEMPDSNDDYECPCCHSHFSYQREVEVTYCSQPVKKAEAKVI